MAGDNGPMVRCGIAGWTDRGLIGSRRFYPPGARTSEERLRYYASQFPVVEVDSTFYGLPPRKNAELWVARTPSDFIFDVKSFALFTKHPASPRALPPEIRDELPPSLADRRSVSIEQLPSAVVDAAWEAFRDALTPLRDAGRLGAVFFQYPPWFTPTTGALSYIEECQERMFGFPVAVEFRRRTWMDERHAAGTLAFLRSRDLPYVAVDVPQGFETSMPSIAETTSERLAVVRFHGRNRASWNLRGAPPSVRHRHNYADAELAEWVPRIAAMAESASEVHAIMSNNHLNWATANARRLEELLAEARVDGLARRYPASSPGDDPGELPLFGR